MDEQLVSDPRSPEASVKIITDVANVVKPGWQTTEFYAMCGVQLLAFLTALFGTDQTAKITTGITAAAAVITYIVTRYLIKK
jgi:hypothetical protein